MKTNKLYISIIAIIWLFLCNNSVIASTWSTWWVFSWIIWITSSTWTTNNNWFVYWDADVSEDPEYIEALNWMYDKWLTMFKDSSAYRPFDKLTREEAAKIIWKFYKENMSWAKKWNQSCEFSDSWEMNTSLSPYIKESCQMWLFGWWAGKFFPRLSITKAQTITVLVRMFDDKKLDELTTPRYRSYYNRALELSLTKEKNIKNLEWYVTRYEVAILMYRFNIKYKLSQSNTINFPKDEIISFLSWNSIYDQSWNKVWKSYIDINKLTDGNIDKANIDLFWDKYKIVKRKIDTYNNSKNNFARFWEVYDMNDKYLWTINFLVINWTINEWFIRFAKDNTEYTYTISSDKYPYYNITEKKKTI